MRPMMMRPLHHERVFLPRDREWSALVGFVAVNFLVATLGSLLSPGVSDAAASWYAELRKPPWAPPIEMLGAVWTLLYGVMAVAGWRVWHERDARSVHSAMGLYALLLILSALWPLLFFGMRSPALAFVDLLGLSVVTGLTLREFARHQRRAAQLLVPYFVWVLFAAAFNLGVWRLNA